MHQTSQGRRHRRQHSPQYKAELVQLCLASGASLASIAIDHGLNPNLLRRWVQEHERLGLHALGTEPPESSSNDRTAGTAPAVWPAFVPVNVAPVDPGATRGADTASAVRFELNADRINLTVHWPHSRPRELAHWIKELLA